MMRWRDVTPRTSLGKGDRMSGQITLNLPLAEIALDRDYLARNRVELFSDLWSQPETLVLPMFDQRVLLSGTDLKFFRPSQIPNAEQLVYLGRTFDDPKPVVLAVLNQSQASELEADQEQWHHLRKSGIGLSSADASIFSQALALANWHLTHQYCSACGSHTISDKAGWVRICESEGRELYPRTDPAVIVGVIDQEDRILLGSQGAWEENRWSILAGFVEPGESLEAAVIREMFEEAGIRVEEPRFLASQAWPFPYSLMFGFTAKFAGGEVVPDGDEIVKLRWFSREELKGEIESMLLPGKLSIARAIIEHWLGEELKVRDH